RSSASAPRSASRAAERAMAEIEPTRPRFPDVDGKAGFYESFYLRACDPAQRRGVWVRHTVHKAPGEDPWAALWFVWFAPDAGAPYAVKQTYPASGLAAGDGGQYIA